jgi:FtsP/CotA-like multicopper oxidase with cupredoxin domain
VSDVIKIVFHNNVDFPATVHPHGVFYGKASEGALYNDGTKGSDKDDDAVPPGGEHVYTWLVPERAGPPPGGISSAFWMYHSHTNEERDVNAGLIGPIIITAKGKTFHRDIFGDDMAMGPDGVPYEPIIENINGYLYGNGPVMTSKRGGHVRWYVMAGTGFEVHAPHWHGNTGTEGMMRTDTLELVTMGMHVVDMVPDNVGKWLFHCHVSNHFKAGMGTLYEVVAN